MSIYRVRVFYRAEDEGYIAVVPDLPGCSAFGETKEKALKESGLHCRYGWKLPGKLAKRYRPEFCRAMSNLLKTILII